VLKLAPRSAPFGYGIGGSVRRLPRTARWSNDLFEDSDGPDQAQAAVEVALANSACASIRKLAVGLLGDGFEGAGAIR